MIDWTSPASHWMVSPYQTKLDRQSVRELRQRLKDLKGYIWISSSGTTGGEKRWIGLSKNAFLASAAAVNQHLGVSQKDRWLNILPTFHVGGLSIFARSFLSHNPVVDRSQLKWSAASFVKALKQEKITLVSMVPTQIFDLVEAQLMCPRELRAVVVGGGSLPKNLYARARELGWPCLPSYGLTECGSQVATADLQSLNGQSDPKLKVLSHIELKVSDDRLMIRSPALCDFIAKLSATGTFSLENPKRNGWFLTEDYGHVANGYVEIYGRAWDRVKILGELVSIPAIEEALGQALKLPVCILPLPEARRGARLAAVIESSTSYQKLQSQVAEWQTRAPGLWRLSGWYTVDHLPRTALGKLRRSDLREFLGLSR